MTFKEASRKPSNPRSCLELALEAERVCKTTRDFQTAIRLFRQALAVGTDDITVLSAIYSQLGNAYFYEHDFFHALEFHRWDLSLSRQTGDPHGEAKACANLSTCFKMIGKYPEAVLCAKRQLEICRRFNDKAAIARALYNLGNAYHAKGRQFLQFSGADHLGEFTAEAKQDQERALVCFQENLALVCELGDRPAEGRAYGNLGNTHYLLGNFREAVDFHKKRLQIAKEFGDLRAQRRAYSNLGNAYIFLADFGAAARSYKHALGIARQLGDETLQAQACFSLGHSCTLLRDYSAAVVYYLRHLNTAWETGDRVGQGRCHWSLANVYAALGDYQRALRSSLRHRKISKELNDEIGLLAADLMIVELHRILDASQPNSHLSEIPASSDSLTADVASPHLQAAAEARALEQVLLFDADSCGQGHVLTVSPSAAVVVPSTNPAVSLSHPTGQEVAEVEELSERELDAELSIATSAALAVRRRHGSGGSGGSDDGGGGDGDLLSLSEEEEGEDFVVVVSPSEAESGNELHRSVGPPVGEVLYQATNQTNHATDQSDSSELLFDLLFKSQALRMNDQRCDLNAAVGGNVGNSNNNSAGNNDDGNNVLAASGDSLNGENDSFLDLLINLQGARMNDQRADFPGLIRTNSVANPPRSGTTSVAATAGATAAAGQSNSSSSPSAAAMTANGGSSASAVLAARMRSASDGLAEEEQVPSIADELAPGDDFFDMILRLQQRTRINDQRSALPPSLQTHSHRRRDHQPSSNGNAEPAGCPANSTAAGNNGGGSGAATQHRLLRVLSVPGGKRRRRIGGGGGGGGGGTSNSSKSTVV